MKQFAIYRHPTFGFEAVKNGFSWPAFFFTWIWMLFCRMWFGAIAVLVIVCVGALLVSIIVGALFGSTLSGIDDATAEGLFAGILWGCGLVASVIVGAKGNAWRRNTLTRRGFKHETSIQAASADAAVAEASSAEQKADEAASS